MIISKPPDQLAREDLIRQTVEEAVRRIERLGGNVMYRRAYNVAIAAVQSILKK